MRPKVHPTAFVHPAAEVIGDVRIGPRASIWPGSVLRADTDKIVIGEGSNIQDGAVIHCDPGVPTVIGKRVTVGHQALLHGARIADDVLVGMGAIVMAAKIGRLSLIGAGALVLDGKEFPANSVILGSPAKWIRKAGPKERQAILRGAENYIARAQAHQKTSFVVS